MPGGALEAMVAGKPIHGINPMDIQRKTALIAKKRRLRRKKKPSIANARLDV